MGLSTHILDTALGRPAAGVTLVLSQRIDGQLQEVGRGMTDTDGRCRTLLGGRPLEAGTYHLRFEIAPYFGAQGLPSLYPFVEIAFLVAKPEENYHIPLLATANGYTTYRGS